ncbi:hypothetical protein TSAR_013064 [Trichomalopsis sarcophagae]|uniref:Uncharacterized protein n=1 Tax=Trichomalopsis sarcophagae TaxID=543379 RepID=A0A232FMQ2_9HYME|nr:hypothetical protein TSAR_013064 [Trichomalopsis sarcophagae]
MSNIMFVYSFFAAYDLHSPIGESYPPSSCVKVVPNPIHFTPLSSFFDPILIFIPYEEALIFISIVTCVHTSRVFKYYKKTSRRVQCGGSCGATTGGLPCKPEDLGSNPGSANWTYKRDRIHTNQHKLCLGTPSSSHLSKSRGQGIEQILYIFAIYHARLQQYCPGR